jgi:hypothetical protein
VENRASHEPRPLNITHTHTHYIQIPATQLVDISFRSSQELDINTLYCLQIASGTLISFFASLPTFLLHLLLSSPKN